LKASFHPDYLLPLPDGHPFPMAKYPLVRERLRDAGLLAAHDELTPEEASFEDLARVHTADYLARLAGDGLTPAEVRALGVPWTPRLLRRSRLAVQGTLLAARAALADGLAGNLAGGTHHAFADHGEGFCVLNDVAVAIRRLQAEGAVRQALVVDLDVHQGNGTAAIFEGDETVRTFSMHGERNYPARKMRSTFDVGLPDGTGDGEYLAALDDHLPRLTQGFAPDIVFYLAGVDVAAGDRYGRFALTDDGLRARERRVLGWARGLGLPMVVTLAGGYAATPERTAALHAMVFEEAAVSSGCGAGAAA
jgi:acetoin utilization deacetylase AcuC-like enzyme